MERKIWQDKGRDFVEVCLGNEGIFNGSGKFGSIIMGNEVSRHYDII